MIRLQRSIRAARGKNTEAVQWAKEVSDYVNSKQPNHNVQAFSSRFGDLSMMVWQVDFEDLAALDKFEQAFNEDKGYHDLLNKAIPFFIEGTTFDTVFETL